MRALGIPHGADDDVACAHRIALRAEAQRALAREDHEHLVVRVMHMMRPRLLPRRHHREVAPELGRPQGRRDLREAGVEVGAGFRGWVRREGDVGDVDEGLGHGGSCWRRVRMNCPAACFSVWTSAIVTECIAGYNGGIVTSRRARSAGYAVETMPPLARRYPRAEALGRRRGG